VKFLHTSDWHVGKAMRGRSRIAEHEAVLAEVADVADEHAVDLVLVVGDLFETAAPAPDAERVVYRALLALADEGRRPVLVVSGNHDNARRLAAVAPLLATAGVTVQTTLARPADGGVVALEAGGVPVRVVMVPFLSQRHVVSAADLMGHDADVHGLQYADRIRRIVAELATGFDPGAVNLVAAHLMVVGGVLGGGERSAQTIFEYGVPATAFPGDAHYVALGHLHRRQRIDAACPVWYCGSPLQLDFGEGADVKAVNVVTAVPGTPASVTEVVLAAGRELRTVRGSLAEMGELAGTTGDAFLRVVLTDSWRAGLADDVRTMLPDAVDVRVEATMVPPEDGGDGGSGGLEGRSPGELFGAYLAHQGVDDQRLLRLFDELVDEADGEAWPEDVVDAT
jgi:exonuclease SbcD